jgi:hypothetical protein
MTKCTHDIEIPPPDAKDRIPATNEIRAFIHCNLCLEERPPDQSPMEWARLNVGTTPAGFQVWCVRHDANVVHIDFEGRKHPANGARALTKQHGEKGH